MKRQIDYENNRIVLDIPNLDLVVKLAKLAKKTIDQTLPAYKAKIVKEVVKDNSLLFPLDDNGERDLLSIESQVKLLLDMSRMPVFSDTEDRDLSVLV